MHTYTFARLLTAYRATASAILILSLGLSISAQAEEPRNHNLDPDILYLSDDIKARLDTEIRPIYNRTRRALALHWLMFDENGWNIDYSSDHTYTAQETFDARKGNCMSLAALFVASARYVNLPAKFQSVQVGNIWTPKDGYYLLTGHVNASVRLRRQTIYFDFLQTFLDIEIHEVKKKSISDNQAYAEYHNNIAMELIEEKRFELAKQHMDLAVNYDPKSDFIWSNYGVLHKFNGEYALAESKYKKALSINKKNFSALTNLYIVYADQGRDEEAQALAKKVEKYSRKNPYYISKLALTEQSRKNYPEALSLINKAIRKDKKVARFYHIKAQVLYDSGKYQRALKALEKARSVSEDNGNNSDKELYSKKIDSLISKM